MRVELPTFKRCCFCIPLRRGLLLWAYCTLIFCIVNVASLASILHRFKTSGEEFYFYQPVAMIVLQSLRLILYLPDIVLTVMFIYGAHTKNYKLFRIYYFSTVILTIILVVFRIATTAWLMIIYEMGLRFSLYWIVISSASSFIFLGMQIYLILMVRSEMIKLGQNCAFRFHNIGTEAECQLNMEQNGALGERELL